MRFFFLLLFFCISAQAGPARFDRFSYQGWAEDQSTPGVDQYRNPILAGYYPDPSVLRVGDDYYLVNSSFAHFPGLPVFTSTDLINWRQIGNAIDRPTQINLSGRAISEGLFAPDISYHDGRFYLVNTCVECGGNFVITAEKAAGPWSDPQWLGFEGIDPSIFWDGQHAYIVNNRPPNEPARYPGHRAIWIQEFDWRQAHMIGASTQIVNGGVDLSKRPAWIEGPHLIKRSGFYYLIAAEGGTAEDHSEVVFRSRQLRGPYRAFGGNPILTQRTLDTSRPNPVTSAGHADIIQTQTGEWWATFLATRPYSGNLYNIGRETYLLPVQWRDGWPRILPAGAPVPLLVRRPALPHNVSPGLSMTGDLSYVERFKAPVLGAQWIGVRTPQAPVYQLVNGGLVLDHGAPLGDRNGVPAFVGRRQQHHLAIVTTSLVYTPDHEGDRAGLAAIQSDDAYLFFGVTRLEGRPAVTLYTRTGPTEERLVAHEPLATSAVPMTLTIRVDRGRMSFAYLTDGAERTLVSDFDATFLSTQVAGGFVGTIIGPFARNQ